MSVKNEFLPTKRRPHAKINIYNLQAIEILESAGISEPNEQQIKTIERLLKATKQPSPYPLP